MHMVQVMTGVVVRLYAMQLVRAITTAGVLENFDEGRCYLQHGACMCSPPGSWHREEAAAVDQRVAS
jgi:intergrase/recombinase